MLSVTNLSPGVEWPSLGGTSCPISHTDLEELLDDSREF